MAIINHISELIYDSPYKYSDGTAGACCRQCCYCFGAQITTLQNNTVINMDPDAGYELSRPYWNFYKQCMDQILQNTIEHDETRINLKQTPEEEEYAKFIAQTRKHQLERDEQKVKQKKLDNEPSVYYQDVSQVSFKTHQEIPDINEPLEKPSASARRETELVDLYGGHKETYEKIRSIEMSIDEHFSSCYQRIEPQYWPVIPISRQKQSSN